MNKIFVGFGILLASLCSTLPVKAENPQHLKQLRETKHCPKCDLSGADLSGVDLSFAVLVGANLSRANLSRANLSNADLSRANLKKADLSYANLDRAYLDKANLHQTKFIGASLSYTTGLPVMTVVSLEPLPLADFKPLSKTSILPEPKSQLPTSLPKKPAISKPINSRSPYVYPPKIKQAFVKGCSEQIKPELQPACGCIINNMQKEYSLNEFLQISSDLSAGKKPPVRFMQITSKCMTPSSTVISSNFPIF